MQATSDSGQLPGRRALIRAAKSNPYRPPTSGPAGMRAGPAAIPARPEHRRRAGTRPPGVRPFIRAANLNPYRPHCRQSRIPAAPLTSGPAGMQAGGATRDPARPQRRHQRASGPLASELHPRCQAESLLPPSPPAGVQPFWSNSALCGPSVASSPISRPRCAGGQCMEKVLTLLHLGSKAPNRTYPFGSLASSSSPPGPGIFRLGILPSLLQSKCFVIQAGDILSRLEPKSLLPVPPPWVDVA
jgi:hypothetical protein